MKIKVLLVDDEKLERVLIRKGYAWEENGFEIIGEASDGEEALEVLSITTPDIIVTDINMPYMDGLKLTEEIRKRNIPCKIVIVTGYRDFDYARRALKSGVKDFLLKPVQIKDLKEIVESIKEEWMEEKKLSHEINTLKEIADENQDIVKQSFLQLLVENRIDESEGILKLQLFHLSSLLEGCNCMSVKIHRKEKYVDTTNTRDLNDMDIADRKGVNRKDIVTQDEISKSELNYILSFSEEINKEKGKVAFVHYLSYLIIYVTEEEDLLAYGNSLKTRLNKEGYENITIGISDRMAGFSGISKAYRQAEKAISAGVILGTNTVISYHDYEKIKKGHKGTIDINWKDFIFQIENCIEEPALRYIDEYTGKIKGAGITDNGYLKLMAMNMLSKASVVLTKHGTSLGQLMGEDTLYNEVSRIETVGEMNRCIKGLIKEILRFSDSFRNKKRNKLIDEALLYIEEELYSPDLSLKTVASQIFVNESYLSRVFKLEVGESLIEYITRKRIERSIVLLNTTDLKAYEIAEQIGICDPHYFSICFKKHTGVTVKEYKKPIV